MTNNIFEILEIGSNLIFKLQKITILCNVYDWIVVLSLGVEQKVSEPRGVYVKP